MTSDAEKKWAAYQNARHPVAPQDSTEGDGMAKDTSAEEGESD